MLYRRRLLVICFLCVCMLSHFSCVQLFVDPVDDSLPGSSVHGILQARILEWVAMPYSKGSSQPRDQTQVSCISCIAGGFFIDKILGKPHFMFSSLSMLIRVSQFIAVPPCPTGNHKIVFYICNSVSVL